MCGSVAIGLIAISDRASSGVYEDRGIPALQAWLEQQNAGKRCGW